MNDNLWEKDECEKILRRCVTRRLNVPLREMANRIAIIREVQHTLNTTARVYKKKKKKQRLLI